MSEWKGFLALCPERVRNVIENGPMPLADYPSGCLNFKHKNMGIQRYKGGSGRGCHGGQKVGSAAVVYYDPTLAATQYQLDDIPEEVLARHSDERVKEAFDKL